MISVLEAVFASNFLSSRAGIPATTVPGATSFVTIAPAATTAPSPMRTPSKTTTLRLQQHCLLR